MAQKSKISLKPCCIYCADDGGRRGIFHLCLKKGQKKWRREIFIFPRHSEQRFELKNSEFRCEMKF
jgi:hypothetical protein